jgi:hypothetical protein
VRGDARERTTSSSSSLTLVGVSCLFPSQPRMHEPSSAASSANQDMANGLSRSLLPDSVSESDDSEVDHDGGNR